jgi:VanZ family protein
MTLCLIPAKDLQKIDLFKISYQDLVVHLVMFFAFSTLLYHDLKRNTLQSQNPAFLSLFVLSMSFLLGISTEMLQFVWLSIHRSASVTDFLFDLLGAALGIVYMRFIKR